VDPILLAGMQIAIHLEGKPRMADFANIMHAVDSILDTTGLRRYLRKQSEQAAYSLSGDAFIEALARIGPFEGTSSEIHKLVQRPDPKPRNWPPKQTTVL
jgi:hypothetical protein